MNQKMPRETLTVNRKKKLFDYDDLKSEIIPNKVGEILAQSEKKGIRFNDDATKISIQNGWVKKFSDGQWVYLSKMAKLFRVLINVLRDDIARPLKFEEWIFPRLLKEETLKKFGCIDSWPKYLFNVSSLPEGGSQTTINKDCKYMLDPVQCSQFYQYLSMYSLSPEDLPIKIFETLGGWTYRNEFKKNLNGFSKTIEFLKTEFVFVDRPKQVGAIRMQTLEKILEILEKLELRWRVVIGQGCYENLPKKKTKTQKGIKNVNEIETLDIELYIPYEKRWLELSSCNILYDEKIRTFNIRRSPKLKIWSGCIGVGINRFAYGFLSQHSFDTKKWPIEVKSQFMKL